MSAWWGRGVWLRGLVGMFAGQVLALSLLFGAIVSAQMSAAATSAGFPITCYGSVPGSGDSQDSPASGLRSHACIICAFSATAPLIPDECPVSFARNAAIVAFAPLQRFDIQSRHRFEPRLPQGPPHRA